MEQGNSREQEIQVEGTEPGAVAEPGPVNQVVDWGGSDGFSLFNSASGASGEWLKDWEGRQQTHDMFHDSYD
ncbi:hypothetical protein [Paenibacillus donghaensis]|uniref:Uncharacterized protein n=1 Tax=Paenibacillus donghaensis TaxID=414771 RepID=A0A2Z2KH92_9BACL|nr:hypothetical protein [Paenibacillus donghaensis]ASA25604.1 hypothetical protein B9T62_35655 [Paenibacillus donghaensis]